MFEITLSVNQSNQRLDRILSKYLKSAPKSFIYKMLRKKNITLNGEKALGNEKTVTGDTIQFFLSKDTYEQMRGGSREIDLPDVEFPEIPILYEDSDVCIFVKPAGILSQKAIDTDISVNEWVVWHAIERGLISGSDMETFRPSVCNRLDRNTSGIMAAGLSERGLQVLSEIFRERSAGKYYYAMVQGRLTEAMDLKGYLRKDERTNQVRITKELVYGSRPIRTEVKPLQVMEDRTLVSVQLHTGKSHQIRAHLAFAGFPLLGDPKYGNQSFNLKYHMFRQCLHSCRLEFPECGLSGISGRTIESPVPSDWPVDRR